jgi:hypothetical protein
VAACAGVDDSQQGSTDRGRILLIFGHPDKPDSHFAQARPSVEMMPDRNTVLVGDIAW